MKKDIVTNLMFLKKKSEDVSHKEVKDLIKDLEDTLKECPTGIGLSAIQIGILKRVGIIRIGKLKVDIVNPKIINKEDKIRMEKEGCLSLPNLCVDTIRYNTITIRNNGKEETYSGLVAVAVQHEIDHLNGVTILDRKWKRK